MTRDPYTDRPVESRLGPEVVAEIRAWTAAKERARRAYQMQPNACTREIFRGGYR